MAKFKIVTTRPIQVDGAPDGQLDGNQEIATIETDLDPKTLVGLIAYSAAAEIVAEAPAEAPAQKKKKSS